MKLFAKYLPVKGKPKEFDWAYVPKWGTVQIGLGITAEQKNLQKMKLFLCSTDIKIGDNVKWIDNIFEPEDNVQDITAYTIWTDKGADKTRKFFKVLGEISSDSEVQEYDEFQLHDLSPLSAAAIEHNKPITEPIKIICKSLI